MDVTPSFCEVLMKFENSVRILEKYLDYFLIRNENQSNGR